MAFVINISKQTNKEAYGATIQHCMEMMHVICDALNMPYDSFVNERKDRVLVDLRFITALLIKEIFPCIALKKIGEFFGGQDHTSVINAIQQAKTFLENKEYTFVIKYHTALASVHRWLIENHKGHEELHSEPLQTATA